MGRREVRVRVRTCAAAGGRAGSSDRDDLLSSHAYHGISASSVRSPSRSARVNSSAFAELAAVVDLLITSGWIFTHCAGGTLRAAGWGWR
jgi:hypothetical protein